MTPKTIEEELALIVEERKRKEPYYRAKARIRIQSYEKDFDHVHNLDKGDWIICTTAGILGGVLDVLFVGIPHPSSQGVKGGFIDGKVREWFDKHYPESKMQILASRKECKTPYDAQDNRHTEKYVDGLSSYYHRLVSLGHDPFLGFFVGVYDILKGRMTTISKTGDCTSQKMPIYAERMAKQILEAIQKEWLHLKSDVNTSMGLPVPLMSLFNLLQFGHIGEEGLTVAEIVQGMYYQGYDFQHFCAMSIPEMFVEITVRAAWWIKMKREGHSLLKTMPIISSRNRTPKLDTMLCVAHACFCSINAGKVGLTKNPCAINYSEWMRFSQLVIKEVSWQLINKSTERQLYVTRRILEKT